MPGRRLLRLLVAFAVAGAPFVLFVPDAFAGVGLGVTPNFPSPISVGQTGLPASITIVNNSNGPEAVGNVTLNTITLTPSCGAFTANTDCSPAGADPGVLAISSTAVGRAGTACANTVFTVTVVNPTTGQLAFTPNNVVILGPPASATSSCAIDFTFDVSAFPTKDVSPAPGVQTEQIAAAIGIHADGTPGSGTGTSFVTVADTTAPLCAVTALIEGPPRQVQITVQDTGSGLAAAPGGIVVFQAVNATVVIPPYAPGTTAPVVVTATKIDQTTRSVITLRITDRAGNATVCDPIDVTIRQTSNKPATQVVPDIPSAEHLLTVFNGTPGIRKLVVEVSGRTFKLHLADGQSTTIDLASAMKPGLNTMTFRSEGRAGSTATALLHD